MSDGACDFCDAPATHTCPTCSRPYCDQHGDDVCAQCMAPDAGLPSGRLYLGAIAALLAVSAVGVFLFINPPTEARQADAPREITQPPAPPTATATPSPSVTPTAGEDATPPPTTDPGQTGTTEPTPGETGEPAATPTGTGTGTYSVVAGDSLSGIAEQFGLALEELLALNPGLDPDAPLQIDQEIIVPSGGGQ